MQEVWQTGLGQAEREAEAIEKSTWPVLDWEAGYRFHWRDEAGALVGGVSMPIPFWNSQQGALLAAQARKRQVVAERRAVVFETRRERGQWEQRMRQARLEADNIREKEIPLAEEVWGQVEAGFRMGRLGMVELLAASQSRLELQEAAWEAEGRAREAQVEWISLQRVMGNEIFSDTLHSQSEKIHERNSSEEETR
jgi:cobalt-zinc-cadmium efflux system outer membrane protein